MSVQLLLTNHFYKELDTIYEYSVRERGELIAEEYLEEINQVLQLIQENPKVLMVREEISPHFQTYLVNKHWLICHVSGEVIVILTIIHTTRNVIERLDELEPKLKHEVEVLAKRLEIELQSE